MDPKKTAHNSLTLEDKELKIKDNKITFSSGMSSDLTTGSDGSETTESLIFLSKAENYDDQDLKMYTRTILETNIHREGFKPNNRIKCTRAYKYSHIIKKLIDKDLHDSSEIKSKLCILE